MILMKHDEFGYHQMPDHFLDEAKEAGWYPADLEHKKEEPQEPKKRGRPAQKDK